MNNREWMAVLFIAAIFVIAILVTGHHGAPPGYWGY